jgi:hypothetical protein
MPYSPPIAVFRKDSRRAESQRISDRQAIVLAALDQTRLGRLPWDLRAKIGIKKFPSSQAKRADTRTPIDQVDGKA